MRKGSENAPFVEYEIQPSTIVNKPLKRGGKRYLTEGEIDLYYERQSRSLLGGAVPMP
jgi:hypothetical protein